MKPGTSLPVLLLALFLAVFIAGCAGRTSLVRGDLRGELRWEGTILVEGDVVIEKGASLRILPGTNIVFLPALGGSDRFSEHPHFPGSELIVRGAVIAEGTADYPITFRYADADAPPGSWGGVNLVESPYASFKFCRFIQADSALHSQSSQVFVEESIFSRNQVGLRFHSSEILVEKNLFTENGTAIRFHYGAPVIRRNEISGNVKGLFITSFPQAYRIDFNNIVGNREAGVILGEEVPEDVHMRDNFWGEVDERTIEADFFDGRRIEYLGKVIYLPRQKKPVEAGISWNP